MPNGDPRDYLASPLAYPSYEESKDEDVWWAGPEHGWVTGTPGGQMGPLVGDWGTPGGEMGPRTVPRGVAPRTAAEPVAPAGQPPSALSRLGSAAVHGAKTGARMALAPAGFPAALAVNLARPLAESVLAGGREVLGMSEEEKKVAGGLGTAVRAGQAGMKTFKEEAIDPVVGRVGEAEEFVFGERPGVADRSKMPTVAPAPDEAEGTSDQTLEPTGRIGARIVDGKVIFTNVGVGGDPTTKTGPDYREGVSMFREKMRAHQAGLGPPPPGQILSGAGELARFRPGGHMLGDPDAPLPGDPDYPTGGFVSKPGGEIADPTKALTEEGWAAMTPAGKRAYLSEVLEVGAAREARAAGTLAEHDARMATDPEYAAQNRLSLYQYFVTKAGDSGQVKAEVAATMANYQRLKPGVTEDSPEWTAAEEQATKAAVNAYLNEKHGEVAKWDDILSRNLGLTFS